MVEVCALADEHGVEVSPHNPAGPVATMGSLHAAALSTNVTSIELAFSRSAGGGKSTQLAKDGRLHLMDKPGWGVDPAEFV